MNKIDEEIARKKAKISQTQQQLRDLEAQAGKKRKEEDKRRNFIYGKAYLAALETLSKDQREKSLRRVHSHIESKTERKFLGLAERSPSDDGSPTEVSEPVAATGNLPFAETDLVKPPQGDA
ncbi:hypothetical protein SAMN05444413_104249 [Roseivivax marinus]|uniref:hypothetical protein n=1 Tax=Roseivivax marinus TaxID=1379903 RepID=UPI0008AB6A4B|nr:hypothetical protein [Roseivivax marinus]SEK94996.1 hypothetical protein SAMN05444413_104249 [Roseivivax marinus]